MKFRTIDCYKYWHCAFEIRLASGSRYVFDPTGIQFGVEWPLLCSFEEFERRLMHPDAATRRLQLRPLGSKAKLCWQLPPHNP